ncbi:MAG: hypothetical protein ACFFDP_05535, partial [Promethearchaeota archaeon]
MFELENGDVIISEIPEKGPSEYPVKIVVIDGKKYQLYTLEMTPENMVIKTKTLFDQPGLTTYMESKSQYKDSTTGSSTDSITVWKTTHRGHLDYHQEFIISTKGKTKSGQFTSDTTSQTKWSVDFTENLVKHQFQMLNKTKTVGEGITTDMRQEWKNEGNGFILGYAITKGISLAGFPFLYY